MQNIVRMGELIGKGYKEFWNFKGRYRVVKGGRGSKKSCDTSIWIIYNMMKYFVQYGLKPNTLVIRKHYSIQKESTFAQLRWAINKLHVSHLWKVKNSPLELEFLPSGQRIILGVWMTLIVLLLLLVLMANYVGFGGKKLIRFNQKKLSIK